MKERLSAGQRKHIAKDLKPEARQAMNPESAWQATEKVLVIKVTGYPESFIAEDMRAIKEFFRARWEYRQDPGTRSWQNFMEKEFLPKFPEEVLDRTAPALAIISQIFSH